VATAINNHNVVVGYSALTDGPASPHGGHAFRWTAEEGMTDLNDLLPPGVTGSYSTRTISTIRARSLVQAESTARSGPIASVGFDW
jgi:probable HAF family extracellular repeat protein